MKVRYPFGPLLIIALCVVATSACVHDDSSTSSGQIDDDADDDTANDDDAENDDLVDDTVDDDTANDDDAVDDDTSNDDDVMDDDIANDDMDDDSTEDVWTDSVSGLIWQNGDADGFNWSDAVNYCENLSWAGFDDWRLPTISQLRSLIRNCVDTATGGHCGVTDDCLAYMSCWNPPCNGCSFLGGLGLAGRYWPSEIHGAGWIYWSSSVVDENPFTAWRVHFYSGLVSYNDKDYLYSARCVRLSTQAQTAL